jgi:hypothetical protein
MPSSVFHHAIYGKIPIITNIITITINTKVSAVKDIKIYVHQFKMSNLGSYLKYFHNKLSVTYLILAKIIFQLLFVSKTLLVVLIPSIHPSYGATA